MAEDEVYDEFVIIYSTSNSTKKYLLISVPSKIIKSQRKFQILHALADIYPTTDFHNIEIREIEKEPYLAPNNIIIAETV
jgi:hypothetical protein